MKRRGLQIRPIHRRWLYSVSLLLFISGASWAWISHLDENGQAGESLRRLKTRLIAVHGFAAVTFVFLFGTLLVTHVRRAWHARKNRWNGGFFLITAGLLTVSGYALYYLSDEKSRAANSQFHLWLGLVSPALLVWHILSGRKSIMRD